jgi:glutamate-ammonia-ligase adenylyltransferase
LLFVSTMKDSAQHLFDIAQEKIPISLRPAVESAWRSFRDHLPRFPHAGAESWLSALPRVFATSDYVARHCIQHPDVLLELVATRDLFRAYAGGEIARRAERELAGVANEAALKASLRALRRRELVRIAWRDLAGLADLNEVMAALSELADACLSEALTRLHAWAAARHGEPKGEGRGEPPSLIVLGLGKLGGRELNFSSDIDLIFAYPEEGETAGPRRLSHHEFFVHLGQALINTLQETTAEGFVFRVDMRLRPNGASGPLALSFDAMEQYYQTHGREWERYALIKTRVCAGNRAAGEELLRRLRPFVFRKYLDYGALEAIRSLKAMIEREVTRQGMQENIKLGPGGIREIEFIVQALQLVRGGREPPLMEPALLKVLPRLAAGGHIAPEQERELASAYVFLRNTEHRLQMVADRQTHSLPTEAHERLRLAYAMGYGDWAAFAAALARHRRKVQERFSMMFAAPQGEAGRADVTGLAAVWLDTADPDTALKSLRTAGFTRPEEAAPLLAGLRAGAAYSAFSSEGRTRMDRLMPLLLSAAGLTAEPHTTLARLVGLLEAIGRRSAYLALLVENPVALSQLVKLVAASPWIAHWIARHPIVLDELLDPRDLYAPLTRASLADELRRCLAPIPEEDLEMQLELLREFRHGHVLRVAAADIGPGLPPEQVGWQLAGIAEAVLEEGLRLAWQALAKKHGRPTCAHGAVPQPGFAVIGYGKLGGCELGYASDLDMIFLYEDCPEGTTDGVRPIPHEEFFARLGQRLIHYLTTRTSGGILYDVDMRLRPSGQSGPLVTSLAAFSEYQTRHAWTWEHQALVRARAVAGEPRLCREFARVRQELLCRKRDPVRLGREVVEMRAKMVAAHPAEGAAAFDVKQGRGGIVDIEFMVQYCVLRWAHAHPKLTHHTDNIRILEALRAEGLLDAGRARRLTETYRRYLSVEHRLKLMERGAVVDRAELGDGPEQVARIWDETFGK